MDQKSLPNEVYLWQCPDCERVMDLTGRPRPSEQPPGRHLKPAEDHEPRSQWCIGKPRRVAYRRVTQRDYTLRA